MPAISRVLILRSPTARGKRRAPFSVDVWQAEDGWHWKLPNDTIVSAPFPTRAATIDSARTRDGLRPDV